MKIRNLALLRFDFVLGDDSEELVQRLEDVFGTPKNSLAWFDIRDNELRELTFQGKPGLLGFQDKFNSLTVRVIELTGAVTQIITLATVNPDSLEGKEGLNFPERQAWEHHIGNIRTFIPGSEQGPETVAWWIKVDSLPQGIGDTPKDLESVHQAFSEEEPHEFLGRFNVSAGRGFVALDESTLIIPGDPSQLVGRLVAFDLDENVSVATSLDGLQLPGCWSTLSTLFAIHYWCRVIGKRLEDFEEGLDDADTELPSDTDDIDLSNYLDLDSTIYDLQEEWISLYGQVSRETRELSRQLENHSVDFTELSRRQLQDESIRDDPGLLETYVNQLDTEIGRVKFDSERLDNRLDSLSTVFHNRVSLIATRENIDLQTEVSNQTEESLDLQSKVFWFTMLVGALTIVLVADASMSGGMSSFIDHFYNQGLYAVTSQMQAGLLALAALGILWYYRSEISNLVSNYNQ